uniref:Uncharacterized protein n=1 Tax=Chaetoceros debilis TaxID=122233 RepID=A0A6S8YPC1_9STRA
MRCYLSNPPLLVKASLTLALILSSMSMAILASSAEAAIARPFPLPTSTSTPMSSNPNPIRQNSKALNVRGGGGWNMNPLDGVGVNFNAAITKALPKLLPKLGLAASTAMALSTNTVLDKYIPGIDIDYIETVDPMSLLVARRIGASLMHYSIIAYLLQCHDDATWCSVSVPTAVGLGALPIIVELAKGLFDGIHKEFGYSWELQALVLFVFIAFSYSFLNESFVESYVPMEMEMLLKMYSAFLILNGVFVGCFTKLACKTWGNVNTDTAEPGLSTLPTFVSIWGFSIISVGTLVGCFTIDNSMTTTKALALGTAPFLGKLIVNKLLM